MIHSLRPGKALIMMVRSEHRRAPTPGRGFSLIELVVMITIISIISVVAIASTRTTYQTKQRTAANSLASDLTALRQRSIATGNNAWASINTATDTALYSETISASVVAIIDQATGTQLGTRLGAASESGFLTGVEIGTINGSTTTTTIGFDWLGRPLNSGGTPLTTTTTITVTASQGSATFSAITLTIQPETGLVAITW